MLLGGFELLRRSWLRAFSKTSTGAFAVSLIAQSVGCGPHGKRDDPAGANARERKRFVKVPFRSTATTRSGWRR